MNPEGNVPTWDSADQDNKGPVEVLHPADCLCSPNCAARIRQ